MGPHGVPVAPLEWYNVTEVAFLSKYDSNFCFYTKSVIPHSYRNYVFLRRLHTNLLNFVTADSVRADTRRLISAMFLSLGFPKNTSRR
jgi:hypothetical protein